MDYIIVEVKDANHKGIDLGRLEISFLEFCASTDSEKWYRLQSENQEELPSCISLLFEIRGPICPQCGLYIGEEESVTSGPETFHTKCLVCVECSKPKPIGELITKNGRFFDSTCYERRFGSGELQAALHTPLKASDTDNTKLSLSHSTPILTKGITPVPAGIGPPVASKKIGLNKRKK